MTSVEYILTSEVIYKGKRYKVIGEAKHVNMRLVIALKSAEGKRISAPIAELKNVR